MLVDAASTARPRSPGEEVCRPRWRVGAARRPQERCAPQHEVRAPTSSVEPARTPCSHRCAIPGSPMLRAASRSPSAPRSRPATTTATPRRARASASSRCPTRSRRWRRPSRRMTSRWRTSSRTSSCVGRLFQTSRFDGPLPLLTRAPAPLFAAGLHRRVSCFPCPALCNSHLSLFLVTFAATCRRRASTRSRPAASCSSRPSAHATLESLLTRPPYSPPLPLARSHPIVSAVRYTRRRSSKEGPHHSSTSAIGLRPTNLSG